MGELWASDYKKKKKKKRKKESGGITAALKGRPSPRQGESFSTTRGAGFILPQDDVTSLLPSICIVVARFVSYGAGYWGSYELQCGEAFTGCNAHRCRPVLKYKYIYGASRSWRGSSGLLMVVSSCLQSHKNMASHGFSIYQALGGHMATLVNVTLLSKTVLLGGKQGVSYV